MNFYSVLSNILKNLTSWYKNQLLVGESLKNIVIQPKITQWKFRKVKILHNYHEFDEKKSKAQW